MKKVCPQLILLFGRKTGDFTHQFRHSHGFSVHSIAGHFKEQWHFLPVCPYHPSPRKNANKSANSWRVIVFSSSAGISEVRLAMSETI